MCVCGGGGGGGVGWHLLKRVERTLKIIDHREGFATNPLDFCWQFLFLSHIFCERCVWGQAKVVGLPTIILAVFPKGLLK